MYKVYSLSDPRTNQIMYIGCTFRSLRRRFNDHMSVGGLHSGSPVSDWKLELQNLGLKPIISLIEEIPEDVNWEDRESFYIAKYRSTQTILNRTDGGVGARGLLVSEESRRKSSIARSGDNCSAETRAKMRLSKLGKKHSPESLLHMSLIKIGKTQTEETKNKIRNWHLGKKVSEQTKAKLSKVKSKPVRCIETGEIFPSSSAASLAYSNDVTRVSSAICRKCSFRGLHWEYVN